MRTILTSIAALTAFSLSAQVPSYVPTNGLVGWWPFNGNANDESGNGNNGVVNGATLTEDRFGNSGSCYLFPDNNNTSSINLGTNIQPSQFTYSVWSYKTNTRVNGFNVLLSSYLNPNYGFEIQNSQLSLGATVGSGNSWSGIGDPSLIELFEWDHVAVTFNGTHVKLYVNGARISNCNLVIVWPNTGLGDSLPINNYDAGNLELLIGDRPVDQTLEYNYEGKLDDIGIWNRALDECEIQAIYNAGAQGVSPTPVGFTGLNSSYILSDAPSTLVGSPSGGVFIGPGVTGNTFDPASAGIGSHSITYAYVDACGSVNVQSFCTEVTVTSGVGGSNMTTGGFLVYPNPNRGQFTVELDLMGLVSLQVFDARGALVHNEVFRNQSGKSTRVLDLSNLAKGSYTLTVTNDGQNITQQVVIQ
jgi:hypothetical protein